jgi:spore maturation protein CgeB
VYHPEFVRSLKKSNIYTVIVSADDPESSDYCSKPYVHAFDHSFAWSVNYDNHTKTTDKFKEWGARRADWWPYGVRHDMWNPALTEEDILTKERDIDLIFVGSSYLKVDRLASLKKKFPQMIIYGAGWNLKRILKSPFSHWKKYQYWDWGNVSGAFDALAVGLQQVKRLPMDDIVPLYQRAKIGINIHMSYGPSNRRTFELPANGVMQVCDCIEGIGQVFEIGKEVVAYRSLEEAIEQISYFLQHDNERKEIAAKGFRKILKNYTRVKTFSNALEKIKRGMMEDGIFYFKDGSPVELDED